MNRKKTRNATRKKYLPNSSPVPNWVFDEALKTPDFPDAVLRVLLYLLRRTVGWDKETESCTVRQIQDGTSIGGRRTVSYAITVVCECLGLFTRIRGKGRRPTVFTIRDLTLENYVERTNLLFWIYDRDIPTMKELKARPCTAELLAQAKQEERLLRERIDREVQEKKLKEVAVNAQPERSCSVLPR